MNTTEMIEHVAFLNNSTRAEAKKAVDSVLDAIRHGLSTDGTVRLGDIGTFNIRHVAERQGTNPQTGAQITIKASNRLNFSTNAAFKRKIQ